MKAPLPNGLRYAPSTSLLSAALRYMSSISCPAPPSVRRSVQQAQQQSPVRSLPLAHWQASRSLRSAGERMNGE